MAPRKTPRKISVKSRSTKKVTYKRGPTKVEIKRSYRSRVISFFIGVATVVAIGFIIFSYAQSNNYKQVLGASTNNLRVTPIRLK